MSRLVLFAALAAASVSAQEAVHPPTDVFVRLDERYLEGDAFAFQAASEAIWFAVMGDEERPTTLVAFVAGVQDGKVVGVRQVEIPGVIVEELRPDSRTIRQSGAGEVFMRYPPPQIGPWLPPIRDVLELDGDEWGLAPTPAPWPVGAVSGDGADAERIVEAARSASPRAFEAGEPLLVVFGLVPACESECRSDVAVFVVR